MQRAYRDVLESIKAQQEEMAALLMQWSNINSHSENTLGLSLMLNTLRDAFLPLNAEIDQVNIPPKKTINIKSEELSIPLGGCLVMRKHPQASLQIFLGGHMDTVYPATSPFQKGVRLDEDTLNAPGAADMKGGLIVMLKALQSLESSPYAGNVGWTVLINSDEEIGSPGSQHLLKKYGSKCKLGLIFEPSLPNGDFVSARKGSVNFTVAAKGKSAHAGRDFYSGRNAIYALADFIVKTEKLMVREKGITINVGQIQGGEALNIVPDAALCRINLRASETEDFDQTVHALEKLVAHSEGLTLHKDSEAPPKPFDRPIKVLFKAIEECCVELDCKMDFSPSGGTCDGSRLYAAGVPNIDTLGVIGGDIHTEDEYVHLPSLYKRAQLTTLFLMKLANKEIIYEY
jgi:glutamate carboxypeptidase